MRSAALRLLLLGATFAAVSLTDTTHAAGASLPGPTPGTATLAAIKQAAGTAISNRETALQKAVTDVNAAKDVTASDKSTLLSQLQAAESGLTALNGRIQADTTVSQAWSDAQLIVTDYRVYVLELPKAALVVAADTENAVEASVQALLPKVQAIINASSSPNKAAAQAALNDCTAQVGKASSASSGVSASIIGLVPSDYPGSTTTLQNAKTDVQTARTALAACRQDLQRIKSDLGA